MKLNYLKTLKQLAAKVAIAALGSILLFSCNDNQGGDIEFKAIGDVMVQKKLVDNEEVYAPLYYVYGNGAMASVTVTSPSLSTTQLESFSGGTHTFYKEPEESDFSTEMVAPGVYSFSVAYGEGENYVATDLLSGYNIDMPLIDSTGYNDVHTQFFVQWESVEDVDLYVVKLYNMDGNLAYNSPSISSGSNAFSFDTTTEGWLLTPYADEHYKLQVHAFIFDSNATLQDWMYNIECNSFVEKEIVWDL